MPGIAGLISRQPADRCRRLVEQMTASMQHEKFYVSRTYAAPELGIFSGWIALQGSLAHSQPVVTEHADVALLFAGEFLPDRDAYDGDDAAWLIRLYEKKGEEFFNDLNGLFSGLLIDRRTRQAFLFNDRYGMERIYCHEGRDGFYFASEAKALLRVLPELRTFDEDGLAEFLHYGCTLEGKTLFRDIGLLPAASVWTFADEQCDKRRYFSPTTWESQPALSAERFTAELQDTLTRVLPRYFESDGPIGMSLTGGLDTRMIMACRPEPPHGLVSYTWAGLTGDTLDARLAARVAAACQVPHHIIRIGHDFFSDFASLADRTVYITDGTFGVSGAHEIYLNNQARALAPVRLTGNFGSEILRGATTFKPLGLSRDLFHPELRERVSERAALMAAAHPVSFAAFQEIPWHLVGVVRAAQSQVATRTPYFDNEVVALAFRTPEEMRRSSSLALKVVRQKRSQLARIPTDQGLVPSSQVSSLINYFWHRASFKLDYWYGDGMPQWLSSIDAHLSGLGVRSWSPGRHKYLHYRQWFRAELAGYLQERLTDAKTYQNHLWNPAFLDQVAKHHSDGRKNYISEINAVLTLEAVERLLLRQPANQGT